MSPENDEKVKTDAVKSRDPLVGTNLGDRFYIEEVLGSGGMSVVYKAKQLAVNRHVAIKTIRVQLDAKPVYRERFEREISSLCALSHPNVVTVYDCIIGEDGQPYVVMDYLRGRSLETLIEADGPLPVDRFARISMQVCSAMDHAHKRGIIHRDLKPGNIVLMDDEMDFVKVVDFGLAKLSEDNRKLTQSGELWGSPPYMSPEQCMGESGDERSDIYALGCVMYEMLTGKDPFWYATTIFELIQRHVNTVPASFAEVNPAAVVPYAVESVIFQAMEKNPVSRFNSALELRDALMSACANSDRNSGELYLHPSSHSRSSGSTSGSSIVGGAQGSGAGFLGSGSSLPAASGEGSARSEKSQQMAWFAGMLQTGADEFVDEPAAESLESQTSSMQSADSVEAKFQTGDETATNAIAAKSQTGDEPAADSLEAKSKTGNMPPPQPRSKWARPTGSRDGFESGNSASQSIPQASDYKSDKPTSVTTTPHTMPSSAASMEPVDVGFNQQAVIGRDGASVDRGKSSLTAHPVDVELSRGSGDVALKAWLPYVVVAVIICAGIAIVYATMSKSTDAPQHRITRSTTNSTTEEEDSTDSSRSSTSTIATPENSNSDSSKEEEDQVSIRRPAPPKHVSKPKRQPASAPTAKVTRPSKVTTPAKPQQPKTTRTADPWKDLRNLQGR